MADGVTMIARLRPRPFTGRRVVAVRWALDAGVGFPAGGFTLERNLNGAATRVATALLLPGARQALDGSWSIEARALEQDLQQRRAPFNGARRIPDLPDRATAVALLPLLTFCLPLDGEDACQAQFAAMAEAFANAHTVDAELTVKYWNFQSPPPVPALIAMRGSTKGNEAEVYGAVHFFYARMATAFLMNLAVDFGVAKLLGLGVDDLLPELVAPGTPEVIPIYSLACGDAGGPTAESQALGLDASYARPPERLKIRNTTTLLGYPAFARFYRGGATWTPKATPAIPNATTTGDDILADLVAKARKGPRLYQGPAARLCWLRPRWLGDGRRPALSFEAVGWRVERHRFDRRTALDDQPPNIDFWTFFRPCPGADGVRDASLNSWVDDQAMPWGVLPYEGWHAYRARGIDVFGMVGAPSVSACIRLRDDIAPPPPRLRNGEHRVDLRSGVVTQFDLPLAWGAIAEFSAPDAVEFRVRQHWTRLAHIPVTIKSTDLGPPDGLVVNIELTRQSGQAISEGDLRAFVGGTLMAESGEFSLLGVEASHPPTMRVQRLSGRAPELGDAAIQVALATEETGGVAPIAPRRVPRDPATAAIAALVALDPLTVILSDPAKAGAPLPGKAGRVHLVALDDTFDAEPGPHAGMFVLTPDDGPSNQPPATVMAAFRALSIPDARDFFDQSPALFLPARHVLLDLQPPPAFVIGTFEAMASTADAAPYHGGGALLGNEGASARALFTAYSLDPPGAISCPRPPMIWARGGAEFVEHAQVNLFWPPAQGALCYEVERALESALGLPRDADDLLLAAAAEKIGDPCFERRTNRSYGVRWSDYLPGRAPTRAVYRVRAVTPAGVTGDWAIVAIVRVPDIRIAPPPNLFSVEAPDGMDRTIGLQWTQAGPAEGIGFRIEARRLEARQSDDPSWDDVASFLPGQLQKDGTGSYHAVLPDQPPGLWREFRIIAIRHALDPKDPRARLYREIDGRPSLPGRAFATGELRPPRDIEIGKVGKFVELRWVNDDHYEAIEVRRRRPDGYGFERFSAPGVSASYRELGPLTAGRWTYELAAIGSGRRVLTDRIVIEIP